MLIFMLFLGLVLSKCRLWNFYDNQLHTFTSCNDWEMFYQCKRAQDILDHYLIQNNLPFVSLDCMRNIKCILEPLFTTTGTYYCQQIDSYNICVSVKNSLGKLKQFPIDCIMSTPMENGSPVYGYYSRKPVDGITTSLTFNLPTPKPNVSSILSPFLFLIVFIFI
jgi:hypothetical protein